MTTPRQQPTEAEATAIANIALLGQQSTTTPATGTRPMIGLRLSEAETARLDRWAKANGYSSRSEAIRALIERALKD